MAQKQIDVPKGVDRESMVSVAAGSAIGTAAVRVIIDDGNAGSKLNALRAIMVAHEKVNKSIWPPV